MFKIIFLSSNNTKISHVSYLLEGFDVELLPPPDYGKPYIEPRISNREELLALSIESANQRLARKLCSKDDFDSGTMEIDLGPGVKDFSISAAHQNRIFFIEDTSVVIDALSVATEYPGVDIKYWMRENDFAQVDKKLKRKKNNRKVFVRSDIVLYLPPALREKGNEGQVYKVFTGETKGTLTHEEYEFEVNSLYPWLDNKTFNKWFIPLGESDVISRLPIEVALKHDFRKKAIDQMLSFLESKRLIKRKGHVPAQVPYSQIELFSSFDFVFCGPTCSGKTVLASFLSKKFSYLHIEASDFMKKIFYERHGLDSALDINAFAKEALELDSGVVANQVADYILSTRPYRFIVTGFRCADEIEILQRRLNRKDLRLIYIDSPVELRFKRNVARDRSDTTRDYKQFVERNSVQESMGLPRIKEISEFLNNESTLFSYLRAAAKNFVSSEVRMDKFSCDLTGKTGFLPLEQVIILSLFLEGLDGATPLTTSEIARSIKNRLLNLRVKGDGVVLQVNKNNVSRYFNQKFNIHFKVVKVDRIIKYELSQTGKSAAMMFIRKLL